MIGIYKITNKINGKSYIGQSVDIERRWRNHKQYYKQKECVNYKYALYSAFRKYGIENFDFQIIEECDKDSLNDREIYWIDYYDTFKKGYNNTKGGGGSYGQSYHIKLSEEDVLQIQELLKYPENDFYAIADMFNVSYEMIRGINTGKCWHNDEIDYPIAKYKLDVPKTYCIDCGKEISKGCLRCADCNDFIKRKVQRPAKEELLDLIIRFSFNKIGKMFNVSDNTVRKWCKQYELPYKYHDLKKYANANGLEFRCG